MNTLIRNLLKLTPFKLSAFAAVLAGAVLMVPSARAVPSCSRQTGFPCKSCHTTPPELTPLGRVFKLNGYTITGIKTITSKKTEREAGLNLLEWLPLSALIDTSFSSTHSPQPTTQNGNFEFPQAVSLFLSGAWSSHVGSFVQATYDTQADTFTWDNTDIRYAGTTRFLGAETIFGVSVNNNPTVTDVWNTTPAWGYPFQASGLAPSPAAATMIEGEFGGLVAGAVLLCLLGVGVGAFGTLVGAGGGFVLTPVLLLLYPHDSARTLTAISLAVIFFNAASGTVAYARQRRTDFRSGIVFAAYVGGQASAVALGGRYDGAGAVFGRTRPATGFSLDLRRILASAPEPVVPGGIQAPGDGDAEPAHR